MSHSVHKDLAGLRRGFASRLADLSDAAGLRTDRAPRAGDLAKVRVDRLGHHRKLELPCGRRSTLNVGDEIVLAYANRYATDQFHAVVPDTLSACNMIAAGGLAGHVVARHSGSRVPTAVTPLGLLCDRQGEVLSLARYAQPAPDIKVNLAPPVIVVIGTSMNAGKTTTAAAIVRAAHKQGLDVCAVKATGTGAGCDIWQYVDAGAAQAIDFAQAGHASTFKLTGPALFDTVDHVLALGNAADLIVCELADGLIQQETRALLERHPRIRAAEGIVLAAGDALSARSAIAELQTLGLYASAVSGAMTASPLVIEEARQLLSCPVLSVSDIIDRELSLAQMIARKPVALLRDSA